MAGKKRSELISQKQIIQNTINENKSSNGCAKLIGFQSDDQPIELDFVAFKMVPASIAYIEEVARDFLEWARTDTAALKPRQFFRSRGIHHETIKKWMKRSDLFKKCYEMGVDEIGDRREISAFHKQASETIALRTMPMYDPDFKELLEWQSSLANKAEQEQANRIVVVEMPSFPKTEAVPERKE